MGKLSNSMRSVKVWVVAILLILVIIFIFQNYRVQSIRFLIWRIPVSLSLALILVAAIGFVAGVLWGAHKARARS